MKARLYTPADHTALTAWWKIHEWAPIPATHLPQLGVIIEDDTANPICAGFLYKTDSAIAWIEFIVSNPLSDTIERSQALDMLIDQLELEAREAGYLMIFTSSVHGGLAQRYQAHGFQPTDQGVTHFVRNLWQSQQA